MVEVYILNVPYHNNVLLVKIEGPVWYTIGFLQTPLLISQPMGKGHLCHITFVIPIHVPCNCGSEKNLGSRWVCDCPTDVGTIHVEYGARIWGFEQERILKVTFRLGIGFLE
jgi:hypothetical protein